MKPVDISGIESRNISKKKINELAKSSKNKNIKWINEFKKGSQPRSNLVKRRMVIFWQIPRTFGIEGRTTSLSY
jgi:hypothetical protein